MEHSPELLPGIEGILVTTNCSVAGLQFVGLVRNLERSLVEKLGVKSARFFLAGLIGFVGLSLGTTLAQTDPNDSIVSTVMVTNVSETSATITWITDGPNSGLVHFGTAIGSLRSKVFNPALVTQHTEILSDLTPSTRYLFQIQAFDSNGNGVTDDNDGNLYRFTTLTPKVNRQILAGVVVSEIGEIQDEIRRTKTEIELFSQNSQSIKARIRAKFKLEDERTEAIGREKTSKAKATPKKTRERELEIARVKPASTKE